MALNFQNMFGTMFGQGGEGFVGAAKGLTAVSGIMGAAGSFRQNRAEREAAETRAAILRRDAQNRRAAAQVLRKQGREQAQQIQVETAQLIGQQRAALAANGIVVGEGTAVDLVVETAGMGAVDAITAIANAEREAAQITNQAQGIEMKAGLTERAGQNRFSEGLSNAGSTLLSTARAVRGIQAQYGVPSQSPTIVKQTGGGGGLTQSGTPVPGRKPVRST